MLDATDMSVPLKPLETLRKADAGVAFANATTRPPASRVLPFGARPIPDRSDLVFRQSEGTQKGSMLLRGRLEIPMPQPHVMFIKARTLQQRHPSCLTLTAMTGPKLWSSQKPRQCLLLPPDMLHFTAQRKQPVFQ
jgi:hypothetical protein